MGFLKAHTMNGPFFRTIDELKSDSAIASSMLLVFITCLIGAWVGWLSLARVAIYRDSYQAKLAFVNGAVRIDAPVSGRIVAMHFSLGDRVRAHDTLVELDAQMAKRQLDEATTQLAALAPQLSKVVVEVEDAQQADASAEQTGRVALDQARVRWQGAEKDWETAHEIARRYEEGREVVSQVTLLEKEGVAKARRAEADELHLEVQRLASDLQTRKDERVADILKLEEERKRLEGEQQTIKASIKRLESETQRYYIRAPVGGTVVGFNGFGIGSFVPEGGRLGTIAPPQRLKAIADFPSAEALGHILPGQRAWVRLKGFPWTQYGTISATVKSIGSEPHDGLVHVDLTINPKSAGRIPIREGLLGSAEVEVEHISPAILILRAAGTLMTPNRSASVAQPVAHPHDSEPH